MKADLSRHTFDAARHYSSVRYQQGRVQLDADFNEQADIVEHRVETETRDVVGRCGAPLHDAGFALTPDVSLAKGDFLIGAGRYYVDGLLCENESPVPFTAQPDRRGVTALDVAVKGSHVAYLDVWQRHVTALDDPRLRETALGGPDTATRAHLTWQVRTVPAGPGTVDCATKVDAYTAATAPSTGTLRARAVPASPTASPCIVPAAAGYQGLENQLYRVEVHGGGAPYDLAGPADDAAITASAPEKIVYAAGTWNVGDAVEVFLSKAGSDPMAGHLAWVAAHDAANKTLTLNATIPALALGDGPRVRHARATFKWSRDNGSVEALVKSVSGTDVVLVQRLEPDDVRSFAPGQWVELSDDARELEGVPGHLAQIASVSVATNTVVLRAAPAFPGNVASADPARHLRIRRWDGVGAVKVGAPVPSDGYVALEDGVQVRFEAGSYRVGDHWLIPARTATADAASGRIEWPEAAGAPAARPPLGIAHHYCRIAVLTSDGTKLTIRDCRPLFEPLTDPSLVYVGGDGQEAMPGTALPQLLEAGVFRGTVPVAGATVRFSATAGQLAATQAAASGGGATFQATTGANGVAQAGWLLKATGPVSQQVVAELLDGAAALGPRIDFNGSLSIAREVAYDPSDKCPDLKDAHTVQAAIDVLCARPTGGGCSVVVTPDQSLSEIIDRLIKEGHRELCLCLTAGDHQLPDGLTIKDPKISLELCGCEAGTRVSAGARIALSLLRSVTIADIDLTFGEGGELRLDGCPTVQVLSCEIRRLTQGGPVCSIRRARRIRFVDDVCSAYVPLTRRPLERVAKMLDTTDRRVAELDAVAFGEELAAHDNLRKALVTEIRRAQAEIGKLTSDEQRAYRELREVVSSTEPHELALTGALIELVDVVFATDAGVALLIMDGGAETEIAESRLIGDLVFYGTGGAVQLSDDDVKRIGSVRRGGLLLLRPAGGTLHLRENALTGVAIGDEAFRMLKNDGGQEQVVVSGVFRNAMLTDNVIARPRNALIARHAVLTANEFYERDGFAGVVIADSAIYASNHGNDAAIMNISNASDQAANVSISIVNA